MFLGRSISGSLFVLNIVYFLFGVLTNEFLPEDVNVIVRLNIFLHMTALILSIKTFDMLRIPFIAFVSLFNLVEYGYVLLSVPASEFQLGLFRYEIMVELFIGFVLFYVLYFSFIFGNSYEKSFSIKVLEKVNVKELKILKYFLIFLYAASTFFVLPVSGLDQVFTYTLVGFYYIGYIKKTNNLFDDIVGLFLFGFLAGQALLSGFIFAIVYLGIFIVGIHLIYGRNTRRSNVFILTLIVSVLVFSSVFSKFKFQYRAQAESLQSNADKINLMIELNEKTQNASSDIVSMQENVQETTLWRMSYAISALSLVTEKTPTLVPFWQGSSYVVLITKFIPRFLWPNKPKEEMGQRFGHTYGILNDDDTNTSMNTPVIAEGYMNFGYVGFYLVFIIMSGLIFFTFKQVNENIIVDNGSGDIIDNLILANLLVIFIQWESNLSMMLGKIFILYLTKILLKYSLKLFQS